MKAIDKRIERVLLTKKQIEAGIKKAANWINKNYKNKKPILIGILNGVIPFYGHLFNQINTDAFMDFMVFSSYQGNVKAVTEPKIVMDIKSNIKGRHVIVVEDIVDTGKTLTKIVNILKKRQPASIKVVTLLDKKEGRTTKFEPDYNCFNVPNHYIVGFGFDYQDQLRNLPYIGILKECIYNKNLKKIRKAK